MNTFNQETPKYPSGAAQTPYLRAKKIWDERTATFASGAELWRKIALASIGFCLALFILLLISLSWHKPDLYVAEVSQSGQVMNVKLLSQNYSPTEAQEEYFIVQFIKLIRQIPLDPVAAKNNWLSAYNFLTNRGAKILNQFFQQNNPLTALNKKTVTVTITDINPISKNTFQVDWIEESVDQNGQMLGQQGMSGIFTITLQAPTTKEEMLRNPLGIYLTDFHISPRVAVGG
jgi:type IV secretion system protein VirB5